MTPTESQHVLNVIDSEGFDYTFHGYSNFEEVKDEEFHRLRKEYVAAGERLATYLGVSL